MESYETIAAISTPNGEGGIGIIRVSGDLAEEIGLKFIRKINGEKWRNLEERHVYLGKFVNDKEQVLDEVIFFIFREPHSYTKENVLEIHLHGNQVILKEILQVITQNGARLAEPGEFTKRAFLNGRIDLSQAEGVIDLIRARTLRSGKVAATLMSGELSQTVESIQQKLIMIAAEFEAQLDYPEDELGEVLRSRLIDQLTKIQRQIEELIFHGKTGKFIRDGLTIVIVGRPNVGKSSLLNALIKEERAIVTNLPGTTRDILIEEKELNGIPVRFVDTAGIHQTDNPVEQIGIKRAKQWIDHADLILFLLEADQILTEEDYEVAKEILHIPVILVINKTDMGITIETKKLEERLNNPHKVFISAEKRIGLPELERTILNKLNLSTVEPDHEVIINRVRHQNALEDCLEDLKRIIEALERDIEDELIAIEIRSALHSLAKITGDGVDEEIINEIFNSFCLGK